MQSSWWTKAEQMDNDQKRFIGLNADGRHLLVGPPGCGKTNLLVMRARYIYGSGFKNVLLLTFTNKLRDFICTGIAERKFLEPDQVKTFKSWALTHCNTYASDEMHIYDKNANFEVQRDQLLQILKTANKRVEGKNLYDAILVDEIQDLLVDEVNVLLALSERITVAGDAKQMIYESGQTVKYIESIDFVKTQLRFHYRIGSAICNVADQAFQPESDNQLLSATSQYREGELKSRAELKSYQSRQDQFNAMCESIKLQLRSYPSEGIGVIVPRRFMISELRSKFESTEIAGFVAYHSEDGEENTFNSNKLIHVITMKSAKGVEFRCVHLYGLEELKYPQHRREIIYMAITRAKTALDGYYTENVLKSISSAFSTRNAPPSIDELF